MYALAAAAEGERCAADEEATMMGGCWRTFSRMRRGASGRGISTQSVGMRTRWWAGARYAGWAHPTRSTRPVVEMLEDRRLLAVERGLEIDPTYEPTSLIVQFREGTSSAGSLAAYVAGNQLGEEWDVAPGLREVDLNPGTDWEQALAAYQADPNVLFAEPDYRLSMSYIPNDPDFAPYQWSLLNTGQIAGLAGFDIRVTDAWEVTRGNPSQIVAVIDSGVDYRHPDLAQNMWINGLEIAGNGIDDDDNGYIDDIYGYDFANHDGDPMDDYYHGTHVAGIIAAVADNGIGISGVAPAVKIMALKFLNESGNGL